MAKDYTGIKCHKLTFVKVTTEKRNGTFKWELRCDCGGTRVSRPADVLAGKTQSCGCYQRAATSLARTTHGKSGTKRYNAWKSMHSRCSNPNVRSYRDYGAKGITVCPEWNDYAQFILDMGEPPEEGMHLDRIDGSKGYYKENCRWVTPKFNNRNKSSNRVISMNGETHTLIEWIEKLKLKQCTVKARLKRGWPVEQALSAS